MSCTKSNLGQNEPHSGSNTVIVKYLDKETKATQLSQFELTLQKNDNWRIIR